jgi:hypothetical protein
MSKGRLWLSVPYEEKDHAKQLGARWNPTVRRWWISPADLQRVEASNDSWLMGGGYTIYVTGKLYLNVVDCPCPACREDVKVASLLATGAFEIVEIDDEDSEPCSPMSPAASTEGADADPVYLSHVGAVSDQALRAKIDSLCPTFWPNRYGVYRNHCEACGYEFHEDHDLFGGQCPFTPTADPMCLSPENGAVNLGIDTPIQVDAGLRWTGEYRAAACSKMQEEWPPRSDQLTGLAIESVQIADGASDQSSLDSLPATPRAGFWSKLMVLLCFAWRCLTKVVKAVFWPPVASYRLWRRLGWQEWNDVLDHQAMEGAELIQVRRIRQVARTGTKAYAQWLSSGEQRPIWVPGLRVSAGQYLLVQGGMGYGGHHGEYVFFVNRLLRVLPASAYSRWREHEAFLKKRALVEEN